MTHAPANMSHAHSRRPYWAPSASFAHLRRRASVIRYFREHFHAANILEVDTPCLSPFASVDPHLHSLRCDTQQAGTRYLQTSPEFYMKRLLAAGSGDIYQFSHAFREGELGAHHCLEFTLLEWYRVGIDHLALINEMAALLTPLLHPLFGKDGTTQIDTYAAVFEKHLGLDPHTCTVPHIQAALAPYALDTVPGMQQAEKAHWLALCFTHCIQPHLGQSGLHFIIDYPAEQAMLARLDPQRAHIAQRFELFIQGKELANGFHELTDASIQTARFLEENATRKKNNLPTLPMDCALLDALKEGGLPDCAGVALGIDRLMMCLTGETHIQSVVTFSETA